MKLLVIGSGGREHALCWRLKRSPAVTKLYCSPGNAGIAEDAECVALSGQEAIVAFCKKESIGLVVIGPEQPLVEGLADRLEAAHIPVFGPSQKAAALEGSKAFTKELCRKYAIPTAAFGTFDSIEPALEFIRKHPAPVVVKADGLAAGKGVIIAENQAEAEAAAKEMLAGQFGAASKQIVIEEFLEGEELSFFALCDGKAAIPFGGAQDHKRVGDGDQGPNTGGMGAYSPPPKLTKALEEEVMARIILPTMEAMKQEGRPFKGVLFAGLMLTKKGPMLLEYNARFGDPETQALMLRADTDLAQLLLAAAKGDLSGAKVTLSARHALIVVMAAKGYPGEYQKGTKIEGLKEAAAVAGVTIFHAGTVRDGEAILANGGRVLGVAAEGASLQEAQTRAYEAINRIRWPEGFCRRDIGWRALKAA